MQKTDIMFEGLRIIWQVMQLKFRKTWQTSHSTSEFRDNFLVTIEAGETRGRGEAGLPPKKPGCYLANANDCFSFMNKLGKLLEAGSYVVDENILDINQYFMVFRNHPERGRFYKLLSALHHQVNPVDRAAISAVEFAIFDFWSQMLGHPLIRCIYGQDSTTEFRSFFSVSLGTDMVQECRQAQKVSPYIKLKFNDNYEFIENVLDQLFTQNIGKLLVLDANAAWSPATTIKVIEYIAQRKAQSKIHCLEQPFPVSPSEEWKQVYQLATLHQVNIMADESSSNTDSIDKVVGYVHGVNIKLEKTGGLIEAIRTILKAQEIGLTVWLGIMISSQLGCAQTFQLSPFCEYGDLDGGLLVYSPFQGGFQWQPKGILSQTPGNGLAITKKLGQ